MVAEQTKLKEAAAALERLRQEKIVKAYKATMLDATQKWIKKNAEVYAQMAKKTPRPNRFWQTTKETVGFGNKRPTI